MAFGAPALSRQAMQQALRNAGALSNTGTPKSSIGEIGRAIGVPASSRYTKKQQKICRFGLKP